MNVAQEKQALRRDLLKHRRGLEPQWLEDAGARIQHRVCDRDEFIAATCVAVYVAMAGEVPTQDILAKSWQAGKR